MVGSVGATGRVLISSVGGGGGCGWLSLALCADAAAASLTAACYLVSQLTTPLAMILLVK